MNELGRGAINPTPLSEQEESQARARRVSELKLMVESGSYRIEPLAIVSNLVKAISDSCDGFNL